MNGNKVENWSIVSMSLPVRFNRSLDLIMILSNAVQLCIDKNSYLLHRIFKYLFRCVFKLGNWTLHSRARNSLICDSFCFAFDRKLNQPMIRKWVNHDSPTCNFWFDLIFDSQVNHDFRLNRDSRRIKIKPNQN